MGKCIVDFNMMIFNRWGILLHETKDINEGWDGTYMHNLVPGGVYVYIIKYSIMENNELKTHKKAGSITVLR